MYRQGHNENLRETKMKSISFSNISKKYGDLTVTSIESLKIEDGEIVCIVGPSGCGKTTTLRIIAGLIQQDEGDVFFGEEVVNNLLPEHRNAAMVFQNYALFPHMTVFDNVAFGLTVRKKSKQDIAERVRSVLELVQLTRSIIRWTTTTNCTCSGACN